MRNKPDAEFDLFAWADSRSSGVIIDARRIFQKRAINFVRLIVFGHVPKETGGEVVNLASRRMLKTKRSKKRSREDAA
ncbi:hypothetical protein ELH44_08985 [Rhizobium ruizarguesonis]|uniref:hypothetical protein n=1 Tax=Rhizobium ruizarguesonis TaxID=2081791 RepID=UPI00103095DB|nr:hypothetical protein [Rhizobium ruizarguesonis]TBB53795.1 hypothetical protein ELH44_08985 [Rhizobium ruizarguesonis]